MMMLMIDDWRWLIIGDWYPTLRRMDTPFTFKILYLSFKKVDVANFKDWNFHLRNNFPTEMFNEGNV